jgi:Fe2+ or Zn2+ uptake regulation protein
MELFVVYWIYMKGSETIDILKGKKLRVTPHRLAVYEFFLKNNTPIPAKVVYEKLQKTGIDQVTVYRVIRSLVDSKLIKQIDLGEDQAYFELVDENDHHHVVCNRCKKIADFTGCEIDQIMSRALTQSQFSSIDTHSLELFGVCKKCAQ